MRLCGVFKNRIFVMLVLATDKPGREADSQGVKHPSLRTAFSKDAFRASSGEHKHRVLHFVRAGHT